MAVTATVDRHLSGIGSTKSQATEYSSSAAVDIDDTVADSETDFQINAAIDVSAAKVIYLHSTQNVTVETNNGGSPDNTINLVANIPYLWTHDGYAVNLLTVDVTAFYITNASGSSATFTVKVLQDATP